MKITIAGYYGVHNTGDDLLLEVVSSKIRASVGGRFYVLGKDEQAIREVHQSRFESGDFIDVAQVTGWQGVAKIAKLPALDPRAKRMIADSDMLAVGGGGLLGNDMVFAASEVRYAASLGIPVVLLGMGVNPYSEKNAHWFKSYFEDITLVSVRDRWSYHNLRLFREHTRVLDSQHEDPVRDYIPEGLDGGQREETKRAALVLSHCVRWAETHPTKKPALRRQVRAMVNICHEQGYRVDLFSFSPHQKGTDDTYLCQKVQKWLDSEHEIVECRGVHHVYEDLKPYELVIGDRFHSLIIAKSLQARVVGLAMDSKQREFCKNEGIPWFYPHKDNEKLAAFAVLSAIEAGSEASSDVWESLISLRKELK